MSMIDAIRDTARYHDERANDCRYDFAMSQSRKSAINGDRHGRMAQLLHEVADKLDYAQMNEGQLIEAVEGIIHAAALRGLIFRVTGGVESDFHIRITRHRCQDEGHDPGVRNKEIARSKEEGR